VRDETRRRRNKAYFAYVASQPCLVCRRTPCDAHHLKFAEPRALARKVSDEFTGALCREHHRELHRLGNEAAWWANQQIAPLEAAKDLWEPSQLHSKASKAAAPSQFARNMIINEVRPESIIELLWAFELSSCPGNPALSAIQNEGAPRAPLCRN
jgi:hypothetical protein